MSAEAFRTESSSAIPIQPWMLEPSPRLRGSQDPTDESLLARIAGGDLPAFQAFHERHASRVAGYARRLARRDRTLAEDVAQEVFTSVWTRAASFDPARGDASGWLFTLTRNKLIDLWRRNGKGGPMLEIDDRNLQGAHGPRAPHRSGSFRIALGQALARVSPEQRQAIEMAYFDGLTYQEAARELDLPEGTLKSRIRLGLRAMRSVLEGKLEGRRAAG